MNIPPKIRKLFRVNFLKSGTILILGIMVVFLVLFTFEANEKTDLYIKNSKQESDNLQRRIVVEVGFIAEWITYYIETEFISSIYKGEKDEFIHDSLDQWVKKNDFLSEIIFYNNNGEKILSYSDETSLKNKELLSNIEKQTLKNLEKNEYLISTNFSKDNNNIYSFHFVPVYFRNIKKGYIAAVMDSKQFLLSHGKNYRKENNNNSIGLAHIINNNIKGILVNKEKTGVEYYESNYKEKNNYLFSKDGSYIIDSRNIRKSFKNTPTLKKYDVKFNKNTTEISSIVITNRSIIKKTYIGLIKKYILIYAFSLIIVLPLFYKYQMMAFENEFRKRKLKAKTIKLNKSMAAMNTIVSIVAHDIKGPFTSVLGMFSLINFKKENLEIEQLRKHLKLMESECKKAYQFSENLMNWASDQGGIERYNPKRIDLHTIIKDNIKAYNDMGDLKKIKIEASIPKKLTCYSDENILGTIIRNILINAIKFTPIGGNINIKAKKNNKMAIITIENTGVGMSKDILRKLKNGTFHTTLGSSGEVGNGLGIFLVKRLCKINKSKFDIDSSLENGTKVSISLPS